MNRFEAIRKDPNQTAQRLIKQGWYQVSRAYRILARLPEGMTGMQALLVEAKRMRPWDAEKWVKGLGEASAGDHFLRCHTDKNPELQTEVSEEVFRAFRKNGGDTYQSKNWDKK